MPQAIYDEHSWNLKERAGPQLALAARHDVVISNFLTFNFLVLNGLEENPEFSLGKGTFCLSVRRPLKAARLVLKFIY